MTATKIPVSSLLTNPGIAVRICCIEQVQALLPDYPHMDDLKLFFETHPQHREYISSSCHPVHGPQLVFQHPENKTIISFSDLEFNTQTYASAQCKHTVPGSLCKECIPVL